MYDLNALRRRVRKEGVELVICELCSENFPKEAKEQLTKDNVFVDGYPNLSLLYSMAS